MYIIKLNYRIRYEDFILFLEKINCSPYLVMVFWYPRFILWNTFGLIGHAMTAFNVIINVYV